jgi:hypothetical protein
MASGRMMSLRNLICLIGISVMTSSAVIAVPVEVGAGVNAAGVYIEWSDGFVAEFKINFGQIPSDTITGADLMLTLDDELADFALGYTNWGSEENPDLFVDSIEYLGHSNSGYGGGANWWHYWIKDAGQTEWMSPFYGMSSRTVGNGDMDGWIYGRDTAVPEPATIALLAIGGLVLHRKRK